MFFLKQSEDFNITVNGHHKFFQRLCVFFVSPEVWSALGPVFELGVAFCLSIH